MFFNKLRFSVEKMGFQYSIFEYLKSLLFYNFILIIVAYFHKLQWQFIILLVLSIIVLLPFIIYSQFKYVYEFNRFNDLCLYLKQMIIQYKTHHKINVALEKTLEVYDHQSQMVKSILNASKAIQNGQSYQEALKQIERRFPNRYIQKVHSYLILGEQIGGEHVYRALNNIDYESWQNDILGFQKQKNTVRQTNIYFTVLSVAISLFCVIFFPQDLMGSLFTNLNFQILTWLYFEILIISHVLVTSGLSGKWGDE